jgi:3-hydroxypropanoate dehydrogenase
MNISLPESALRQLFLDARTHNGWLDKPVDIDQLRQLYELTVMGPTSANAQPARFVFVQSREAKEKLRPFLAPGNLDKTMAAPVTVIVGIDYEFYEKLPAFFPHTDARAWFIGNDALINTTAMRNSSLQGAYLIMAARALGLDTGAMSGFDNAGVDEAFFAGTPIRSNFLVNIGYGDTNKLFPRSPRPDFDTYARVI